MISFNFSSLQTFRIYIWYYWNLLLQLRFRRLFRLVCARMSAVSNSCSQACGHQRLRLLCISCSRLQSGRVCGAGMNTHCSNISCPAHSLPRLTVSLDTAQQGVVDCLRGTTGRILGPGQTTDMSNNRDLILPFCQCDKRPDSCFDKFSFFPHYEIHSGV